MKKRIFAWILVGAVLIGGCGGARKTEQTESLTQEQQDSIGEAMASRADAMAESMAGQVDVELPEIAIGESIVDQLDSMQAAVIEGYTGEVDLAGAWQDEVSKRAGMKVEANEDGTYSIMVSWSSSFDETACWEITGTWNPDMGALTYEEGTFYVLKEGEKTGEETTEGGFYKEGEKIRWSDSKNKEDSVFVKIEKAE